MENILNELLPYLAAIIGAWLTANVISFIKTKIGLATYNKMKVVALDIWKMVDENTRLGDLIGTKFEVFENTIRLKFPKITDTDIKILNKSIANEYNHDKPVVKKAIEAHVEEETSSNTNTPVAAANDPTQPTNADVITQLKDLISKL